MKYLFICLLFFCVKGHAQELKDFHPPAGFKEVLKTEGDLDKDGINEIVYIYNTTRKSGEDGFYRVLYICKRENGKIRLWKENHSVVWEYERYGRIFEEIPDLNMNIKNNTLIIEQVFNSNSRHSHKYKSILRYQKGDWYLIGSTYNDYDTCAFDFEYDINFSTSKVSVAYTYGDCDDGSPAPPKDEYLSFSYPFKKLLKMDEYNPGRNEHKIPGKTRSFYY
ncbi:hypothetical protein [Pedobacter caeni]|uniref:Uncharacterized protein n=1 Tax=Pedobacter caeni TaxID=288992 RepID=A0A1M5JE11_9SPHI|nr:hypothetical protein [Pedobacter caeni]SHG38519.1 hypothetical protein SAMN04488522_105301 [Pedobacter caeni]